MFMWPQKVVVCDPESNVIVGTVDIVKTIGWSIGLFISPIESFNHLLVRAELF